MIRSEDVARQAGVSRATVSLVLNGRMDIQIPEATRQRVQAIARELGYRPHRSGRAVRTGKTGNIAFLLSTVSERSLFSPRLLDGLIDAAAEHDQHLLVSRISDEKLTDVDFVPKILREFAADGLVINYNSQTPPRLAELIMAAKIPAIWINDKRAFDCVFPDDFAAAKSATEHLIAAGHTRIGYAGWMPGPHYSMGDRLAGYQAALATHGLSECFVLLEQAPVTQFWTISEPPTAVLCYSPDVLKIVWEVAPKNCALVVIHSESYATLERTFDTWLLPDYALGRAAVELLMQKIDAPEQLCAPRAILLAFQQENPPS